MGNDVTLHQKNVLCVTQLIYYISMIESLNLKFVVVERLWKSIAINLIWISGNNVT